MPSEDTGQIFAVDRSRAGHLLRAMIELPEAGGGHRARGSQRRSGCDVPSVTAAGNQGRMFVRPQAARANAPASPPSRSSRSCARSSATVPGIMAFMQNPPPIRIGGQLDQEPLSVHPAGPGHRRSSTTWRADAARRSCAPCPGFQDVNSDLQIKKPAGQRRHRPRQGRRAGRHRRSQIEDALYAPTARAQVSTIYAPTNQYQVIMELLPQFQRDPRRLSTALRALRAAASSCRSTRWPSIAPYGRPAQRQPLRPVALGHHLVQPAPGVSLGDAVERVRRAPQRHRCRPPSAPASRARRRPSRVLAAGLGLAAGHRHPGHLHRARHSVRELHPSAHDSLRPAVGRLRRAADAAGLSTMSSTSTPSSASSC